MKILVTGASGYLGNKLANKLVSLGNEVHALVRPSSSIQFLQHPHIKIFKGDILDKERLMTAMDGCTQVYHVAAKTGAWAKDPAVFYDVNVEGTRNVLDAALALGVEKTIFTSTSGVIGPTLNKPLAETDSRQIDFVIDYDLSKKQAEDIVAAYAKEGMNVVTVSPSKVYGPGNVSHSLTANAIINTFLQKRITFIPSPGNNCVCFAFADDVVAGHILAMEKGRSGERYILGGINISLYDFFHRIRTLAHCRASIIRLSKGTIKTWAGLQEITHKVFGVPVRFPVKSVDHVFSNYTFSSRKAIEELGYSITPLDEALLQTIHFLKSNKHA
jgi:dihydroflavonol-4-reductase/farnesol dehydrogenase